MGALDVTLDISRLITREVTYKGSFRYGVRACYVLADMPNP